MARFGFISIHFLLPHSGFVLGLFSRRMLKSSLMFSARDDLWRLQESLSKLRVQRQVGVLVLEGRQLRDELQPAP